MLQHLLLPQLIHAFFMYEKSRYPISPDSPQNIILSPDEYCVSQHGIWWGFQQLFFGFICEIHFMFVLDIPKKVLEKVILEGCHHQI